MGYGAWGCKESDTTERLSMPCMMILQLCEYAEKTLNCTLDDESYPNTAVYQKKGQVGASDAAKFMKRVQKCPKHRRR